MEFGCENKVDLLLIHGYGATGISFYWILPSLIKNFHVFTIDLPGFGKSDWPNFKFEEF